MTPQRSAEEGDLLREVWADIEAQERRIIEVLDVVRYTDCNEDRAFVRRGNGKTDTVVLPEEVALIAYHDFATSYALAMLRDRMNERGL